MLEIVRAIVLADQLDEGLPPCLALLHRTKALPDAREKHTFIV